MGSFSDFRYHTSSRWQSGQSMPSSLAPELLTLPLYPPGPGTSATVDSALRTAHLPDPQHRSFTKPNRHWDWSQAEPTGPFFPQDLAAAEAPGLIWG